MEMKKLILTAFIILSLVGCTKKPVFNDEQINTKEIQKILGTKSKMKPNAIHKGYKFYLPQGMKIVNKVDNTLTIKDHENSMYLFINLVAYYHKSELEHVEKAYFYETFNYQNKPAALLINKLDKGYLYKITYNYATVEGWADDKLYTYLNKASIILNSIEYNDSVIDNMFKGNKNSAVRYNPFYKKEDENYLTVEDEEKELDIYSDRINKKVRMK